jgi:spoIIIJ-associated protein
MTEDLQVEATGETVGEAKWNALRELESLRPGLDKSVVRFQVVSEGERGLLGVGYTPARVVALVSGDDAALEEESASALAADVREIVERVTAGLGVQARVHVTEDEETVTASCTGAELGLLIGKHGQTLDAIQYLVNAILHRSGDEEPKYVVVDAAGYRARRQATLESLATRAAERVRSGEERVALEPMSAVERKIVHLRLKDEAGVATESEGDEPHRYVVVLPAGE